MKYLLLVLSFISLNIITYGQSNKLTVELISNKDVFYENENLVLNVKLSNPNLISLYIPDTFNVSSNICANGLENVVTGGNIYFILQPISNWCSLVIEDLILVETEKYIEIKPNSSCVFSYDFGKHINEMFPPACDTLGIKLNTIHSIQAEYTAHSDTVNESDIDLFIGTVKSNVIKLEIRKQ